MAFVSVPKDSFFTDIMKTWIIHFQNTWLFNWVHFKIDTPDTDIDLELPIIVLKKIWDDMWALARNNWYFGTYNNTWVIERQLFWYTYSSMMQFDIITTSISENNKLQWLLYLALQPENIWNRTFVFLRHFNWIDNVWNLTDLKIKFNFAKDVSWTKLPAFNSSIHQYSVTVKYDIDYLSETEVPKMLEINPSFNIY